MVSPAATSVDTIGEIVTNWDTTSAVDQRLRELYTYWNSRRGEHQMPSRGNINPAHIPRLLPFVFLVDVLTRPRDFRLRLAGTHFRDFAGIEPTGRLISEVFPRAFNTEVRYHWSSCVDRKAPKIGAGKLWLPGRDHVGWEGIVLPLSADGESVNMLLGGVVFSISAIAPKHRRSAA